MTSECVSKTALHLVGPPMHTIEPRSSYYPKDVVRALDLSLYVPVEHKESVPPFSEWQNQLYPSFHKRLRDVVIRSLLSSTDSETLSASADSEEKIDMVTIKVYEHDELPSVETWHSLRGLTPKHLDVQCLSFEETAFLEPLDYSESSSNNQTADVLSPRWPLESMSIGGYCDSQPLPKSPFRSLKALTLSYCCGIVYPTFEVDSEPPALLEYLKVEENNAIDMFIGAVDNLRLDHPAAAFRELVIISSSNDFTNQYDRLDFFAALKKLPRIESLDFTLTVSDLPLTPPDNDAAPAESLRPGLNLSQDGPYDLPYHLPSSLRSLRFRGVREDALDSPMSMWIKCAEDPGWLPNLCQIFFRMDVLSRYGKPLVAARSLPDAFEEKFFASLRAKKPEIQILVT